MYPFFFSSYAALDEIIPLAGIVMVFGIPIIAILTAHQRKMAELIHGQKNNNALDSNVQHQLHAMQQQITELKGLMQEHIINNDRTTPVIQTPPPSPSIEQRLNS